MLTKAQNRVTSHSAIVDWTTGERRHLARITPQAEAIRDAIRAGSRVDQGLRVAEEIRGFL